MHRFCLWSLVVVLALSPVVAGAQSAPADEARFQAANLTIARDYLLPRYQAFVQATRRQQETWTAFCRQPSASGFAEVQSAFQAAMDAWMPVQHVRTGPASQDSRIERIYFWPERKNAVAKQLGALLKSGDSAALALEKLSRASVAVQGLPALQLLLYGGDDPARDLLAGDQPASYRCAYGAAVAGNLTTLAQELVDGWNSSIAAGFVGPARETTQQMFTDLLTMFLVVGDFKLALPLGKSIGQAKPKLAEAWRSGRSLRNVELNLASARAMYGDDPSHGFRSLLPVGVENDTLDKLIVNAFDDTVAAETAITAPLDVAVADSNMRPRVGELLEMVRHLRDLIAQRLAPAIGLAVGFNALDGD